MSSRCSSTSSAASPPATRWPTASSAPSTSSAMRPPSRWSSDLTATRSRRVMIDGLHIILNDQNVKSVFVNVFGGITSCDEVANGIVGALNVLGDEATKPLVVRLDGNKVEEGRRIRAEFGHPLVTVEETMD